MLMLGYVANHTPTLGNSELNIFGALLLCSRNLTLAQI